MKHHQPFTVSENHHRWSTTSGSSYVRHPSPRAGSHRGGVESGAPLTPRAAFNAAMAEGPPLPPFAAAGGGEQRYEAPIPTAASSGTHRPHTPAAAARAMTPPPGGRPSPSFAQFVGAASYDKPVARGKRAISSRCTEDHIVFENTKYEYPDDPAFYAKHRPELELPLAGGARWPGYVSPDGHVHYHSLGPSAGDWRGESRGGGGADDRYYDNEDEGTEDTDFATRVLLHGFPGKQRGVTRRKMVTGVAQEKTHDLFAEHDDVATEYDGFSPLLYTRLLHAHQSPPGGSSTPVLGADGKRRSRRHLVPQPQSMSKSFQAVGEEVPYFRGGKKVFEQRLAGDYDQTLRVLRADLQDEPGPFRAHVRVGYTPADSLDYTLQGSAVPERQTRRAFFEIRR